MVLSSTVAKAFLSWKMGPPIFTIDLFYLACKEGVVRELQKSFGRCSDLLLYMFVVLFREEFTFVDPDSCTQAVSMV